MLGPYPKTMTKQWLLSELITRFGWRPGKKQLLVNFIKVQGADCIGKTRFPTAKPLATGLMASFNSRREAMQLQVAVLNSFWGGGEGLLNKPSLR